MRRCLAMLLLLWLAAVVPLGAQEQPLTIDLAENGFADDPWTLLDQLQGRDVLKLSVENSPKPRTSQRLVARWKAAGEVWPTSRCAVEDLYILAMPGPKAVVLALGRKNKQPRRALEAYVEQCLRIDDSSAYSSRLPSKAEVFRQGEKVAYLYLIELKPDTRNRRLDLPKKIGAPPPGD